MMKQNAQVQDWRSEELVTASTQHQRDDYKELSELCLLYLDRILSLSDSLEFYGYI